MDRNEDDSASQWGHELVSFKSDQGDFLQEAFSDFTAVVNVHIRGQSSMTLSMLHHLELTDTQLPAERGKGPKCSRRNYYTFSSLLLATSIPLVCANSYAFRKYL